VPVCGARMSVELVFRGDLALDIFADLAVGFAQLLGDVTGEIFVDLDNLQLDFRDLALGFRGLGDELADLPLRLRFITLEPGETAELDEILRIKIAYALQFLFDQADLFVLGILLRSEPCDLLLQLRDPFLQLLFLAETALVAQIEQLALA
jgi:hypothetical protein